MAAACLFGGGPSVGGIAHAETANAPLANGPLPNGPLANGPLANGPLPNGPLSACEQAGSLAEQAGGLPPGLLLAIGRIESGRWDPARGRMTPWPWAINAAGKGQWFDSKDMASGRVLALLAGGTRSIDVGCFQISLLYHPAAFVSLDEAFDPDANARYAARFLLGLHARTGSWEAAVEAYHSAVPALGYAYRQLVFSTWGSAPPLPVAIAARSGTPVRAARREPDPIPVVMAGVQVWTPMPAGTGAMVVAMPPPAGWEAPRETLMSAPMPPLPMVSYRVMPHR
jgi:hypothetical protein